MTVVAHHVPQYRSAFDERRQVEATRRRREALDRLAARRMPVPGQRYVEVGAGRDRLGRLHAGPVSRHVTVLAPVVDADLVEHRGADAMTDLPRPKLTSREIEVLRTWLMLDSKPAVAEHLFISLGTVNTHLTRIRAKYTELGRPASTKAALVARAVQDGLVRLDEL